jgi:hypothetical protein
LFDAIEAVRPVAVEVDHGLPILKGSLPPVATIGFEHRRRDVNAPTVRIAIARIAKELGKIIDRHEAVFGPSCVGRNQA